jgi:hypothetical protein
VSTETKADNFQKYANVYDSLYYDKDYTSECDFLEIIFKRFGHGNVQNFEINLTFDTVICMFAVLSYQISNDDLFSTICTARSHVKHGVCLSAIFGMARQF